MTQENDSEVVKTSQEAFGQDVKEQLRLAVRVTLITVLEEEVQTFIGAKPYERNEQRRDRRNGHYSRNLETTMGRIENLPSLELVTATRHSSLNATSVGVTS